MKYEVSQTNDVGKKTWIWVFLDLMISHMKQWSRPSQILIYWENAQYFFFISFICIKGFKLTSHEIS